MAPIGSERRKRARKAVAIAALLAFSQDTLAGDILRRLGSTAAPDAAAAQAAAQAAQASAQARVLALQAQSPLRRALDEIKAFQAAQAVARTATGTGTVPDGVVAGGLQVAPGVTWENAVLAPESTTGGRTEVTINQTAQKAILTWTTFNVGQNTDVYFNQTQGGSAPNTWIALNRILDPSGNPSQILGSIKADGQVYLLNRNGILFGGTSQVNVATLIASSLDLSGGDASFRNGLLYNPGVTFEADPSAPVGAGLVTVQSGAKIGVLSHGQAVLLGTQVANNGSIEAPDGQVLLAAGTGVSLAKPVDPTQQRGYSPPVVTGGGVVENSGVISAPRGNITVAGEEFRQNGLLTATTSGEANGSITLGSSLDPIPTITFGASSVTQVLPDANGQKVLGSAQFSPSTIDVYGERIALLDGPGQGSGAVIYAPAGNVTLSAIQGAGRSSDDTRVYVGAGARIDVSGLSDVAVAMAENDIQAQLRANELRDNPLLRDNPAIRGQTVYFDGRLGVSVADLSGYYNLVSRNVSELMTAGGSVTLAANEIVTRQGSVIDLSGGSLRYGDGYVRSTVLIDASGNRTPIERAVKGVAYVGVDNDFVVNHSRWGVVDTYSSPMAGVAPVFEKGYVQGSSAGKLTLTTNSVADPNGYASDLSPTGAYRVLDGSVVAHTVVGPKQVALPTGSTDPTKVWQEQPAGATLDLEHSGDVVVGTPTQLGPSFAFSTSLDDLNLVKYQHVLPGSWFDGHTFTNVTITSGTAFDETDPVNHPNGTQNLAPGGNLTIGRGVVVDLGDAGTFRFTGKAGDIEGVLRAPGGAVSLTALDGGSETIHVGPAGAIDVAGRFTNDQLDAALNRPGPLEALNGGSVSITGTNVVLDAGSLVDATGGGHLDPTGRKLTAGNGGSIAIDITQPSVFDGTVPREATPGQLDLSGSLRGYALGTGTGGALSLRTAYDVSIADPNAPAGSGFVLTTDFFTRGGFSSYSIVGEKSVIVKAGTPAAPTVLAPSQETLALVDSQHIASGTRLDDLLGADGTAPRAALQVLPDELRAPMSLTLSTVPTRPIGDGTTLSYSRDLRVEQGAQLAMVPGSTVQLLSSGLLFVDGIVSAPGGNIKLATNDRYLLLDSKILLGPDALLDASGWLKTTQSGLFTLHSVRAGGTVTLSAQGKNAQVITEVGSVISVAGIEGVADLPAGGAGSSPSKVGYVATRVDGDAGAVYITTQGGELRGSFALGAGGMPEGSSSAGSPSRGLAGLLDITSYGPLGVLAKDGPTPAGQTTVLADAINKSGADNLVLSTMPGGGAAVLPGTLIQFDGDVTLQTRQAITLASPLIGTNPGNPASSVTLASGYVQLTGGYAAPAPDFTGSKVQGDLTVKAGLIDLTNWVSLGCGSVGCSAAGFEKATFISSGDIRLSDTNGIGSAGRPSSGLFSPGALEFHSAQVYVASILQVNRDGQLERPSGDPGFLVQSDDSIRIASNGAPAPVPLSFGERLTLTAPSIEQGGVLRAPQGQIQLIGTGPDGGAVTLLGGSITSGSLQGAVVPFGTVDTTGAFSGYNQPGLGPTKSVLLQASKVSVEKGAVIDVSGGGDLLGWEFVPGNGGSQDYLSSSGGFAVLPSLGAGPAPLGGSPALQDPRLTTPGSPYYHAVVHLQGVPGLPDGDYTLLPAHYALLPGGILLQPLGGSSATADARATRPDGAVIASGFQLVEGTTIQDAAFARYAVMPGAVFSRYSDIATYSFDGYASQLAQQAGLVARTPYDAGTAVLDASKSLVLQGTGRFGAGPEGLLGNLDISAPNIAVLASGAVAPDPSYLVIDEQSLQNFGAGSVLLGGTRSAAAAGTLVTVNAGHVDVDIGAGSPWTGPEILLAATSSISVKDGSVLQATGTVSRDTNSLLLAGDGALLRLSTGARVGIARAYASGSAQGSDGELDIGKAALSSDGSLTLEGTKTIALSADAALSGRQLDLSSVRVNLGDAPAGTPGTTLGAATVANLASSSDLLLRGQDSIQLYGDLLIGGRDGTGAATLEKVTLDTPLLQGHAGATGVSWLTVGELTLRNSGPGSQPAGQSGTATLNLDADGLFLGPGQVTLAGYGSLQGRAGAIEAQGDGALAFGGNLSLATRQISSTSGSNYSLQVGGAVALTSDPGPSTAPPASSLGGRFAVDGATVLLDTTVSLPAGAFSATAHAGALALGSNASIDVRGASVDFQGESKFAPGGAISLTASGDISIDAKAVLDVRGAAAGGDAGTIAIGAGGNAAVGGTLQGAAAPGFAGGSFAIDAGGIVDSAGATVPPWAALSALNAELETGAFDSSRTIRLRRQDIALGAAESIHAHRVVLQSDTGSVTVAGDIAAGGSGALPDGGSIELVGGSGVSIAGTATLDAAAGQPPAGGIEPRSGKVLIYATGGRVDVAPGSVIDVSGGGSGGGEVVVRADRQGTDVAIDRLAGDIRGARQIVVQGVEAYQASSGTVDAGLVQTMLSDASAWLNGGQGAIRSRLGGSLANLLVAPGMVVSSSGDLSIRSDISLDGALGPGYLAFRAAGGINVAATVSDGFAGPARAAALLGGFSSTLAFTSGAGGDITLQPNAVIRTGTGDILLRSGQDVLFASPASQGDTPPVVYTAGRKVALAPGFSGTPQGDFPADGGDVEIVAGRDVSAPLSSQTTSAWLFRYGQANWQGDAASSTVAQQTDWSVVYKNFEQSVGALGGGDVRVSAGRDVVQLQVAIPTTGQLTTPIGAVPNTSDLVVGGGGDLSLFAGGDVQGGSFMLGRGHADVHAAGSVTVGPTEVNLRTSWTSQVLAPPQQIGLLLGLMDATATVTGGSDIVVEGVYDPARQGQVAENLSAGTGSAFQGYTERSAVDVMSLSGKVTYANDPWASVDLTHQSGAKPAYLVAMSGSGTASLNQLFADSPASLRLASLEATVAVQDLHRTAGGASTMFLAPAALGTLELLAAKDVLVGINVSMETTDPNYRRGPLDPYSTTANSGVNLGVSLPADSTNGLRGSSPIHADDSSPARIVAVDGSVCAYSGGSCVPGQAFLQASIAVGKPLEVFAGTDVLGGTYGAQNNGAGDLSWIQAGRDIENVNFTVSGPGAALLAAGRDVVLNQPPRSDPVTAAGNGSGPSATSFPNQALPAKAAANLYVVAGTANGVDYASFAAAYLDPSNGKGVVKTYLPELATYMSSIGKGTLAGSALLSAFYALPQELQEVFLYQIYFTELKQTGIDYNDATNPRYHSYARGFEAISLLFPTDRATIAPSAAGNVILNGQPVETWAQGDIDVLAPYGRVAVGSELIDTSQKGGLVTRRGGSIRVMADENIDLFTSRVFTLEGGDITMWTSNGSITAGAGSKTSVFQVPLSYTMSSDAVVSIDAFGISTGAGIGVLDALQDAPDRPRSRLDLIAPNGQVNAGDAGIRVVGDINIAAQAVTGIDNIQVSGTAAGVPKVEAPNISALTSASQLAQAASQEGIGPDPVTARKTLADLPSIITVEVVGYERTRQEGDSGDASDPRRKRGQGADR